MKCLSPQIIPRYRAVKDSRGQRAHMPTDDSPYLYVACGKCHACRLATRRRWSSRCIFESLCHDHCCMVTLTYDDDHLPTDGLLCKRDLQLYLKRLRSRLSPTPVRFFACGEYGSLTKRPHYHLLLFGISAVLPEWEDAITSSWSAGYVHIGDCSASSIRYVTGYISKKVTQVSCSAPEFTVMSRRPGIGYDFVRLFSRILSNPTLRKNLTDGNRPYVLKDGHHIYFDRYMTRKLLEYNSITLSDDVKAKLLSYIDCSKVSYDDIVQSGKNSIGIHKYKVRGTL